MKILSIRFRNLNSLVGTWSIDFSNPEYLTSGIFAITGTTGSGKSTVLDAISLALYGQTPRLKQISKSTNEIMSRQTGDCFSEVEFSTAKGNFRCHWSQHRARKQPSGDLQPPRHEIVNSETDQIIESKLRNVASKVMEVTGMNFDRFTRSMLLAQGNFSRFLEASSDEKAPILEQITGTEIYSRISQHVHDRTTTERLNRDRLDQELQGFALISDEETHQLYRTINSYEDDIKALQQHLDIDVNNLTWLNNIEKLSLNVQQLSKSHNKIEQQWLENLPLREKLKKAESGNVLQSEYRQLLSTRNAQQKELTALANVICEQKNITLKLHSAKKLVKSCEQQKQDRTKEKHASETLIKEVRELDTIHNETLNELNELQTSVTERKLQIKEFQAQKLQMEQLFSQQTSQLNLVEKDLYDHQQLSDLTEKYTGLRERFLALEKSHTTFISTEKKLSQAQKNYSKAELHAGGCSRKAGLAEKELSQAQVILNDRLKSLQLEASSDISELYELSHHIKNLLLTLNSIYNLRKTIATDQDRLSGLQAQLKILQNQHVQVVNALDHAVNECVLLKQNVAKQEEIVLLHNKIESFELERQKLKSGVPCPLCGSSHHPFVHSTRNIDSEPENILQKEKTLLDQATTRQAKLQTNLKVNEVEKEKNKERCHELLEQLQKNDKELQKLLGAAGLNGFETEQFNIRQKEEELKIEYKTVKKTLKRIELLNNSIEKQRHLTTTLTENLQQRQAALQKAQYQQELATAEVQRLETEKSLLQNEVQEATNSLNASCRNYGTDPISTTNLAIVMQQLESIVQKWKGWQLARDKLSDSLQKITGEKNQTILSLQHSQAEQEKLAEKSEALVKKLAGIAEQRNGLFGSKDPEKEEKRLARIVDTAEKLLQEHQAELEQLEKTAIMLGERASNFQQSTSIRATELLLSEQKFIYRLKEQNFTSEQDLSKFILPENELGKLKTLLDDLLHKRTEVKALLDSGQQTLQAEKKKNLTSCSIDTIEQKVKEKVKQIEEIQQNLGALKKTLAEQDDLKKKLKEKRASLALQQKELDYWLQLHTLIGSADGKKFRNFAQGLTFEIMVQQANLTLTKMSDRYLLVRELAKPLELNIVDNYQAGEIRSTKNLSGGESFIVSLALAFGLASMASKNIQVDSLFLDEGFGTLDEESLEVALNTLSSLQQEGKIIGIISHVPIIKERIHVQIKIEPRFDGTSRITGPGVSCSG